MSSSNRSSFATSLPYRTTSMGLASYTLSLVKLFRLVASTGLLSSLREQP